MIHEIHEILTRLSCIYFLLQILPVILFTVYQKSVYSSNCYLWVNRIKHPGKRMHVSLWQYNRLHCLSVTPLQNKIVFKRWMFFHLVPGLVCHSKDSSSFPNKQLVQTQEILFTFTPFPPPCTHTHLYTLSALSMMFLSRFPSLSTHKAWERHKGGSGCRGKR